MRIAFSILLVAIFEAALSAAPLEDGPHVFEYRVDWRSWHAGDVKLELVPPTEEPESRWTARMNLDTRGFVDSLYDVHNRYQVVFDRDFCAESVRFDVHQGSKLRDIRVSYQRPAGWARFVDRDLKKNRIALAKVVRVPRCVHEELSALARLRTMDMEPGTKVTLPLSNGRKSATAEVKAEERETIETPAGTFQTVRYEALVFNNVLYERKGRLFFWLTDDERRLPVQVRIRLKFIYGSITLRLVREEPL